MSDSPTLISVNVCLANMFEEPVAFSVLSKRPDSVIATVPEAFCRLLAPDAGNVTSIIAPFVPDVAIVPSSSFPALCVPRTSSPAAALPVPVPTLTVSKTSIVVRLVV